MHVTCRPLWWSLSDIFRLLYRHQHIFWPGVSFITFISAWNSLHGGWSADFYGDLSIQRLPRLVPLPLHAWRCSVSNRSLTSAWQVTPWIIAFLLKLWQNGNIVRARTWWKTERKQRWRMFIICAYIQNMATDCDAVTVSNRNRHFWVLYKCLQITLTGFDRQNYKLSVVIHVGAKHWRDYAQGCKRRLWLNNIQIAVIIPSANCPAFISLHLPLELSVLLYEMCQSNYRYIQTATLYLTAVYV